ncbi:hypothetical protein DICSQDRAFT_179054 [Dichomitus squalens LYAD-421 SS1]|uniref:Uncharacterized protein n=1 Tax=Dichomitus squalens TaxID=114155 RepID=A0A4Q9MBI5_9APHY|nr:uncharacterized protein DICSQDRAFT_179054 [Dichomitus squalens LYAD-421 SS1]EJF63806.1 hypothetical protein DICSQDRAFT_179054 [Dichomitus squalens LYAD-421 SS1]TBU23638.1 hypothetical protein BD311DRAFT_781556 [Dichomitus squalens]
MAHVMQPGAGHFSGTYIPTMAGWVQANAFYNAVPFNSKPPPVPPGVNPQVWMNGQWQPNPMFRPQPGMTQGQPMWAPHPGWGAAVAQAQGQSNFNPHKRVANPGDPSYWATKLSDNPLGLENMHIKDPVPTSERHVKEQNGVPHTPWVWVPKELMSSEEASKSLNNTSNPASQGGHPQSQQTDKALPAPPYTSSSRDHSRAPSSSQRDAFSNQQYPASSHSRSLQQAPGPAPPTSAPAAVSSYSSYHQQQQQRPQETQRPAERYPSAPPQQPQQQDTSVHARQHSHETSVRPSAESQSYRDYRTPSASASASASSSASAAAAARERERERERTSSGDREQRDPHRTSEAYSESREPLQPTFSPKIVRTPRHYSSGSRPSSHEESNDTPTRTPPLGSIYASASNAPSRSNSMSVRRQSTMPPSVNTSVSTTPPSSLGLLTFTEEPQALLSPLVVGSTPPMETKPSPGRDVGRNGARDVGRSQTFPVIERPGYDVAFSGEASEREGKTYPRTPRPREGSRQRLSADHEYERGGDRDRSANVTPQPPTRTPPMHTQPTRTPPSRTSPSSYNTRPSPETGAYHARQISRSHTYPSVAPVIPPPVVPPPVIPSPPSTSPRYGSSSQHHSFSSSHHHSSSTSHQHQPSRDYSNSTHQSQAQQYPSNSYSSSSYSRTSPNANSSRSRAASPLRHNPLPRPPAVSPYTESLARGGVTSASAAAAAHQQSSSYQPRRTVRLGYWNRRGDHLYVTDKGERFIVYALRHLANPEELRQYPAPTEGWLDHRGDFIKYDPKVPELLDSLPVQGDIPKRPYSSFVQYVDV